MKSKILLIAIVLFSFSNKSVSARNSSDAFGEGTNDISVGYGFGTLIGSVLNAFASEAGYSYSITGPLYLKFEHGVTDKIGLGVNVAYASYKVGYTYNGIDMNGNSAIYAETNTYSTWSALARINWHFGTSEKFDPYWGLGVGYRASTWSYTSNDPSGANTSVSASLPEPLGFEITIGARYYFSSNIGAFTEVGLAKSVVQFGITAKL